MKKKITMMFVLCMWANSTVPFFVQSAENMYQNIIQEIAEQSKKYSASDSDQLVWIKKVICDLEKRKYFMAQRIIKLCYEGSCFDPFGCFDKVERFYLKAQIKKYDVVISKLKAKCENEKSSLNI